MRFSQCLLQFVIFRVKSGGAIPGNIFPGAAIVLIAREWAPFACLSLSGGLTCASLNILEGSRAGEPAVKPQNKVFPQRLYKELEPLYGELLLLGEFAQPDRVDVATVMEKGDVLDSHST